MEPNPWTWVPEGESVATVETDGRELIRDYVSPSGRILRIVLRIPQAALGSTAVSQMIDRDFERMRDKRFAEEYQ